MFESVVVALDGSPRDLAALEAAGAVAARAGTRLDLVHVRSGPDRGAAKAYLDDLAAGLDLEIGQRHVVDRAGVIDGLVAEQLAHPRSLLCLATHARSGARELLAGSHAGELLRHATRPVLLVGPHAAVPADLGTVQVCVDGSDGSTRGLLAARTWARAMDGRLHLVRVVRGPDLRGPAAELERLATRTTEETGLFVDSEVLHGVDVAATLARAARRLPASVLAVATRARHDARERLLGGTAMHVVHDAPVPVLVLRAG